MAEDEGMGEKIKGVAKEAAGKATGDKDTRKEGEAQQKKAQKADEAERAREEAEDKHRESVAHEVDEERHR